MLRDTTKPFDIERFETSENEAVTTAADFYVDSELSPIMKTERLFDGLDDKDLEILKYLIKGTKQEEICDRTFMSESGVKYRIKKMLSLSETVSKSELVDLISKFDISI
jgi:DNA-binding NarL/FixJ family response regulator